MAVPARNIGIRTGGFRRLPGGRGELKWLDITETGPFAVGAITLLNGLVPGTGATQRIGRKVVFKNFTVKITVGCGLAGATPFRGRVKFCLIYDSQTNATTPSVTDIFTGTNANSNMNLDNRGRFKVLWKKVFNLDQSGGLGSGGTEFSMSMFKQTIYNAGTAGTVADIQTGGLFMVPLMQNASSAAFTNAPDYQYRIRLRYVDD